MVFASMSSKLELFKNINRLQGKVEYSGELSGESEGRDQNLRKKKQNQNTVVGLLRPAAMYKTPRRSPLSVPL